MWWTYEYVQSRFDELCCDGEVRLIGCGDDGDVSLLKGFDCGEVGLGVPLHVISGVGVTETSSLYLSPMCF